jgi:membrane associated rhomboid family serine protease
MPPVPKVTKWLLIATTAMFVIDFILRRAGVIALSNWLAMQPLNFGFYPWQMVTYAFFHGNEFHLLFNLLGLWVFGAPLERLWGERRYAQFLLACCITAAATHLLVTTIAGMPSGMIGISGVVYGLLLAHGILFPDRPIQLLFPPVQMTTRTYVIVFGALELWFGLTAQDLIAHFAHLGGMLGAFLMIRYWRGQPPFKGRRRF